MRLLEDIEETVSPTKHNSAPPFSKIPPPPPDSQFSIDPVEEYNKDAFSLGYDSLLVDRDFEIIVKSDLQKRMIDSLRHCIGLPGDNPEGRAESLKPEKKGKEEQEEKRRISLPSRTRTMRMKLSILTRSPILPFRFMVFGLIY